MGEKPFHEVFVGETQKTALTILFGRAKVMDLSSLQGSIAATNWQSHNLQYIAVSEAEESQRNDSVSRPSLRATRRLYSRQAEARKRGLLNTMF